MQTAATQPIDVNTDGDIRLEEFQVVRAKGHELPDGGIVWSGFLQLRGVSFASFTNRGDGGCNTWNVGPTGRARIAMAAFERLARAKLPKDHEAHDTVVGTLWDAAVLARR